METVVAKVEKFKPITFGELPDGHYKGTWGGYVVDVMIGDVQYRMHTVNGIRTMAAPCIVRVSDGKITVEAE